MWYRLVTPILLVSIGLVVLMLVISSLVPLIALAVLVWLLSLVLETCESARTMVGDFYAQVQRWRSRPLRK